MKKILIVADAIEVLDSLKKMLNKPYSDTIVADNAPAAIKVFREQHIDLIIVDYEMHRINGFDLVKMIRNINSDIPFILLLSNRKQINFDDGFQLGICYFLEKPIKSRLLKAYISDIFS